MLTYETRSLQAVDRRHVHVHQHQIEAAFLETTGGLVTVTRLRDRVPVGLERERQQLKILRHIVGDQHVQRR